MSSETICDHWDSRVVAIVIAADLYTRTPDKDYLDLLCAACERIKDSELTLLKAAFGTEETS